MIRASMTAIFLVALAATGCKQQAPATPAPATTGLPTARMKIGSRDFVLEIARSESEQEKGLMQRDAMPADHGMIFVFNDDQTRNFWMKNTRFPLDILFVDRVGKVVSVHTMKAYDETNTSSDFPARYAIELNQGAAADAKVNAGDVLLIPPGAKSSAR